MIELINITKQYGEFTAVDNISLKIQQGEVCVLLGPSGCGKSTTLKIINRMLEPSNGSVLIEGKHVRDFKPELLRRKIGYVIQYVGLFPHMTVGENIFLGREPNRMKIINWHELYADTEKILIKNELLRKKSKRKKGKNKN